MRDEASGCLTHDAMFYRDDHEFAATLVPYVRAGLAEGQAVAAAVTGPNITLLRDALGTDHTRVSFFDRDDWYARPATTVARWHRVLTEATRRGRRHVRLVGEVGFGGHLPSWHRYEAALNDIFAAAPVSIVCPYDTRVLPPELLDEARRTHPTVVAGDGRQPSDAYVTTAQFLLDVPEALPPVSGPPVLTMELVGGVVQARQAVTALVEANGWTGLDRADDLVLALSEITTNSLRHGGGRRELRVWLDGCTLTCEVADDGPGPADPLAGYRPPDPAGTGGRGLWISRQLCDALGIGHRDGATQVRFAVLLSH